MSPATIAAFLESVGRDESLRNAFVEFAARHGFAFTSDELSDSELDGVTGGIAPVGESGSTLGVPTLEVGQTVKLDGIGERFDGTAPVESTSHDIDSDGYTQSFHLKR